MKDCRLYVFWNSGGYKDRKLPRTIPFSFSMLGHGNLMVWIYSLTNGCVYGFSEIQAPQQGTTRGRYRAWKSTGKSPTAMETRELLWRLLEHKELVSPTYCIVDSALRPLPASFANWRYWCILINRIWSIKEEDKEEEEEDEKYFQIVDMLFDLLGKLNGPGDKEPTANQALKLQAQKEFLTVKLYQTSKEKKENHGWWFCLRIFNGWFLLLSIDIFHLILLFHAILLRYYCLLFILIKAYVKSQEFFQFRTPRDSSDFIFCFILPPLLVS